MATYELLVAVGLAPTHGLEASDSGFRDLDLGVDQLRDLQEAAVELAVLRAVVDYENPMLGQGLFLPST